MSVRSLFCSGLVAVIAAGGAALIVNAQALPGQEDGPLVARARAIHERVLTLDTHDDIDRRSAKIDKPWPAAPRATVKDFVDHIDYLVKRLGIDHVGISSDFDGGGGIDGWNSAAETFSVTLELVRRGYREEQIAKMWSGNLLRVWAEVEQIAKGIQAIKN
jgi:membrane dipeptidase